MCRLCVLGRGNFRGRCVEHRHGIRHGFQRGDGGGLSSTVRFNGSQFGAHSRHVDVGQAGNRLGAFHGVGFVDGAVLHLAEDTHGFGHVQREVGEVGPAQQTAFAHGVERGLHAAGKGIEDAHQACGAVLVLDEEFHHQVHGGVVVACQQPLLIEQTAQRLAVLLCLTDAVGHFR